MKFNLVKTAAALSVACGLWQWTAPAQAETAGSEAYTWRNVAIGGGGFVTGIIFHPHQKDLIYARTDVGGAYRWDAAAQRWIPITDWIGMKDVNLTGIESLAVDPLDPKRVYLAAGTYSQGEAAILRSEDQGRTFQRAVVPVKMGGNESGRFNGERLAVDPNQGNILFFGSRSDGLWKSSDQGVTWQKVQTFPNIVSSQASPVGAGDVTNSRPRFGFRQQPVGIVCIRFDPSSGQPGSATPSLYAAASTTGTNLYRSTDGGVTWEAVPDQPVGFRPNHLVRAPDGMLYLSYGKEPGPNSMSDGAVWKFNPKDGHWTDITPEKPDSAGQPFGYGAVAVDAQRPATLMVTTFAHWKPHDEIFRSTNGGASWTQLWQENTRWDHSNAPYTGSRTPHWMGDIEINPFNSDQVLFTTGYGIWGCVNAREADSGRATRWVFLDNGLEETVPLALISPPQGAHLLSGVGDIDGFLHDDLNVSPAQGTFAGPRYSNTEDLAFAGKNAKIVVRTGSGRPGVARAAISLDGGKTWRPLAGEPPNSGGAGAIAISANGNTIVWTPRREAPYFSVDRGAHWVACAGLSTGLRVAADPVNPARFYAYDPRAGKIMVSLDGALRFSGTDVTFSKSEGYAGGFGGGGGEGAGLSVAPGREGDLWLAFRAGGIFHSTDGGIHFMKVGDQVQQAVSLGFGKAAGRKNYPTLYLAGTVDQVSGLFRSDDTGQTWVRINDDLHQFGWVNRVTGDPRLYGRVYFATGGRGIIYGEPASASKR